ncbi:MAG: type VI secretion system baseplate subunit TssG [Chitinivibrionales bacterium]|nr:type VI secretion system baseplate subunit TssG [Chitinivibrionales bacterium]
MPCLRTELERQPQSFGFFEAVSLLEELLNDSAEATDATTDGRIRFSAHPSTAFPSSDIAGCTAENNGMRLALSFMGLTGASSPLPQYLSEHAIRHEGAGGPLRDFLDLFNSRVYALFYAAWRKHRLTGPTPSAPMQRVLAALTAGDTGCGFGFPLRPGPRNADGLAELITGTLGGIAVTIEEHVPRWIPLDERHGLGRGMRLGDNAVAGGRVLDRANTFRIVIGPVDHITYERLHQDSPLVERVRALTRSYIDRPLDFEVTVLCRTDVLRQARLGSRQMRVGRTAVLGAVRDDRMHAVSVSGT